MVAYIVRAGKECRLAACSAIDLYSEEGRTGRLIESLEPRNTLVADIVNRLTKMIASGELCPGQMLPPQRVLARRFGVGRNTVREAIQSLVTLGLLEARAGKGTWVREEAQAPLVDPILLGARVSHMEVAALHEARSVIEAATTELAASRATVSDIERISSALESMEEGLTDVTAFAKADLEFHQAVADASHNELLRQFYGVTRSLMTEVTEVVVESPAVRAKALSDQREILEAIMRHEPEAARAAAAKHVEWVRGMIESSLGSLPLN
jgi:GntR family transcriptional repressor for pyruvate dehydrogenase complex